MEKPTVTIIPAEPGYVLLLAYVDPGEGKAHVVRRSPIIAWAVETDYRGRRSDDLHAMVSPVTIDGAQQSENPAAILHPDGKTVDELYTGAWFTLIDDWLEEVAEMAKEVASAKLKA